MNHNLSWKLDWFQDEDKKGVLELNRNEYGDSVTATEAYFDWIQESPYGRPIFPVARENSTGKVIGSAMLTPARVSWKGTELPILIGFNLLVDRDYRRQGLSVRMISMAYEEGKRRGFEFMTAMANPKSAEVQKKLGSLILLDIPMVIRPLQMAVLAQEKFSHPLLVWATQTGWKAAAATVFREQRPDKSSAITLSDQASFGEQFDAFWESVKTKYNLMVTRDRRFLNWRFRQFQGRQYNILTANRDGELLGYLVLRNTVVRGIKCGLISDFLVQPNKAGEEAGLHLLLEATKRFQAARMSMGGGIMFTHTHEYKIMRRAGYLPCPPHLAPQSLTPIVHPLVGSIPIDTILHHQTWYMSIADHDAV